MKQIFPLLLVLFMGSARAKPKYNTESLTLARTAYIQGNLSQSITILQNWFNGQTPPRGRDSDAAHLLLARAYERQNDLNLASYHYTRVRVAKRAASEYAAFWEAKMDFERDRYAVAIAECKDFTEDEKSPYYEECLLMTGESQANLGYISAATKTFDGYLKGDKKNPRAEEIALILAEARLKKSTDRGAILLKDLWLNHRYPTTDVRVTAHLEEIGHPPTVNNELELRLRVASLSRTARFKEAWDLYQSYSAENPDQITEQWLKAHHVHIAWSARQYIPYAEARMAEYDESPSGNLAWKIYSAYAKAGDWVSAAAWAREGIDNYGGTGRWYRAADDLARAEMFNGNYSEAAIQWQKLRGSTADFYTAFCHYMAGDYTQSIQTFDENISRSQEWRIASLYWRSKAFHKIDKADDAALDEAIIYAEDEQGWYTLLLQQPNIIPEQDAPRKGVWADERLIQPPQSVTGYSRTLEPKSWEYQPRSLTYKERQAFNWSQTNSVPTISTPSSSSFHVSHPFIGQLPDSYNTLLWGTDEELSKMFRKFADANKTTFPELETVYILRMGGHFPEAARLLSSFYEDWQKGVFGQLTASQNARFRKLDLNATHWRSFFVFVRGHHYGYRYHTKLTSQIVENQLEIDQLEYPIVRADEVWGHGHKYNIDPYLMHGLLRAESAYQEFVVSWAGAIGYIQVMPQTGAKVAYLLKENRYSANDLYEPRTNLRFGMFYFSRLMARFDNAFPLAVGSYNGGPHNMSRWLRPLKDRANLDEFVEHIPYNETRIYIKKVVGNYAEYLKRYEGEHQLVSLPNLPDKDDPDIINF